MNIVYCFPFPRQSIILLERAQPVEENPTKREVKTGLLIDLDDNKNFEENNYENWNFGRTSNGSNGSSWLGDDQDELEDSNESDDEPPDLPEKDSKIRERQGTCIAILVLRSWHLAHNFC